jgi:hypothetical protein
VAAEHDRPDVLPTLLPAENDDDDPQTLPLAEVLAELFDPPGDPSEIAARLVRRAL